MFKKNMLILFVLVLLLSLFPSVSLCANLSDTDGTSGGGTSSEIGLMDPDGFIRDGNGSAEEALMKSEVKNVAPVFVGPLVVIGNVLAVCVLALLGIKWFFAGPRERADLKGKLWAYIVGCALLFAGTNIAAWIINFFSGTISNVNL